MRKNLFTKPDRKKLVGLGVSLIAPALILALGPLGMDVRARTVFAAFVLVIFWWVTNVVERTAASVFLLYAFLLSGAAPVKTVLSFPISENFWTILLAFLFSKGIENSGLAEKLILPGILAGANRLWKLILSIPLLAAMMVFLIPQPISRVILLSSIYATLFARIGLDGELRKALLFAVFFLSSIVNMMFRRGDIILNTALMRMAGVEISEGRWFSDMFLPTFIFMGLSMGLFCGVFRRLLRPAWRLTFARAHAKAELSKKDRLNGVFILLSVLFWALEDVHGVAGIIPVAASTALMFPLGLLDAKDLKSVNVKLMVFLTAAFSIGGTLKASGVEEMLFTRAAGVFPEVFSWKYALAVLALSMVLHMILGSNLTTMSVVVPGIMAIGAGTAPETALVFLIYLAICGHFILPFHSLFMMLAEGKGYFRAPLVLRYGVSNTALVLFCGVVVYFGYWAFAGLL